MFSWPLNGKTYLIRGRQYWRYDEAAARPDPGYPRDLSLWEGAPSAPDDVTVSNTGGRARASGGLGDGGPGTVGVVGPTDPGVGGEAVRREGFGGWAGVLPAPETSPSPQVTPTSSRASTTGASPRAASKPSQTPPNPWVPSSWTVPPPLWALGPPDPPERRLSPETATVSAESVGLRGGLRCSSCLFCPCWWGAWPPPEGNLRLRGRERIAHGAPAGCGCGKSVPGAGLSQDAAGDAGGAKSRRAETQGRPWH